MQMNIKHIAKQCIPPILLRNQRKAIAYSTIGSRPTISNDAYTVEFRRVSVGGEVYFVPAYAAHRPACQAILAGNYYEPLTHEAIRVLIAARPGHMIHAGSFFGDMLPSFSRACPGMVYAFEPVLENYLLARLCVQENNLANVLLRHAGLGNQLAVARIDTGNADGAHRGGRSRIGEAGQLTSLLSIDTLGLSDVSIIHLDIEGSELTALTGATRTIKACQPVILLEDNAENCEPLLTSLGYVPVQRIPGLQVWATGQSAADTAARLKERGLAPRALWG